MENTIIITSSHFVFPLAVFLSIWSSPVFSGPFISAFSFLFLRIAGCFLLGFVLVRLCSLCSFPLYYFCSAFLISLFHLLLLLHFSCSLRSLPIAVSAAIPCISLFPIVLFFFCPDACIASCPVR